MYTVFEQNFLLQLAAAPWMMIPGCREKYLENRAIHVIVRSPSPAVVKTAKFFWGIFESFTRLNFTDLCEFEREREIGSRGEKISFTSL